MHFRTKDLLITVLPRYAGSNPELEKRCLLHTRICTAPTLCVAITCFAGGTINFPCPRATFWAGRMGPPPDCPHTTYETDWTPFITCPKFSFTGTRFTGICAPVSQDPWVINDKEDLAILRADLDDTLEQLKELEKELPSGLGNNAKEVAEGLSQVIEQIRKNTAPAPTQD